MYICYCTFGTLYILYQLQYDNSLPSVQVGSWSSEGGLVIKDIVWPDNSHVPPPGVPEKFHIRITFLEEPPFIIVSEPDPVSGRWEVMDKFGQNKMINLSGAQ